MHNSLAALRGRGKLFRCNGASRTPRGVRKKRILERLRLVFMNDGRDAGGWAAEGRRNVGNYIVQVVNAQPGAPVYVGERIGRFQTEDEARYFIEVATHARRLRGCKLVIRKTAPEGRMAAAA